MAFESLNEKLTAAFKKLRQKGRLTEADIQSAMREVRMALLEADVNYKIAKDFTETVGARAVGAEVMNSLTPAQQVVKIVQEELSALMGSEAAHIHIKSKPPTVLLLCGLQGAGKTTHAAKLALWFKKHGHRPLLVACDTYRPAAVEQLQILGAAAEVPVFTLDGEKPEGIAQKAVRRAKDYGDDVVILDTAGRLQVDEELMQELVRVKAAADVDESILVIDAMAGQEAVNVAKSFDETLGLAGTILTKLDGDARGGAALSVKAVTGKPILFAGTGEKLPDLEPFHPERMASRILGMGDVLTLIEKAQETQGEEEAKNAAKRLMENKFDMNDMLAQFTQVRKMGGIGAMLGMMPGAGQVKDEEGAAKEMKKMEAMIQSMTAKEREKPALIDPKRKRRIAAGSGTRVEDVNRLLRQYEQISKAMKQFKQNPKKFRRRLGTML